ncbi:MAG: YfiR family protein [Colwellia sp.]|nr:YfiR family protein [Colwellia sp.]
MIPSVKNLYIIFIVGVCTCLNQPYIVEKTGCNHSRYLSKLTYRAILTLIVLAISLLPIQGQSAEKKFSEANIKVAYLYNFLRFVEWPEHNTIKTNICIIGKKRSYLAAFKSLEQQKLQNKNLIIQFYDDDVQREELSSCQLIFITSLIKHPENIIEQVKDYPVLTVCECKRFKSQSVMINFINKRKNIKFDINLFAIKHAKLRITSKILRIAATVKE